MPTPQSYIVRTKVTITRKAGDTGSIVFNVPVELDLTGFTDALFQVRTKRDELLFEKTVDDGGIEIAGQVITVLLDNLDTAEKSGTYDWELQIMNTTEIITVGTGQYVIVAEIAR